MKPSEIKKSAIKIKKACVHFTKKETKRDSLVKYFLLVSVLIGYGVFVSFQFGGSDGLLVMLLTWSFFVFCTPVADAGFLLDFPIRLITKWRMVYSEIVVWIIALIINILTFIFNPSIYQKTFILKLFHHILTQPFPYWSVILISAIGTFLSIYFGDELMDVATHKNRKKFHKHISKYQLISFIFLIVFVIILYDFLLKKMGINLPF